MEHLGSIIIVYLLSALLIAIGAFVYSSVLTENGEMFGKLYSFLDRKFKNDARRNAGEPEHWLFKMIIGCSKCVSGQMSFWGFLIMLGDLYIDGFYLLIILHLLFVSLTIFMSLIVTKIYNTYIK